jgi:hypothetical protein
MTTNQSSLEWLREFGIGHTASCGSKALDWQERHGGAGTCQLCPTPPEF